MTHQDVEDLARRLLDEHGLTQLGWTFEWNKRKRAFGLCSYAKKKIYVSRFMFDNSVNKFEEFNDTVRHEVAHALAYVRNGARGHGRVWKAWARKLGATPRAGGVHKSSDELRDIKYVLVDTSDNDRVVKKYYRSPSYKRVKHLHSPSDGIIGKPKSKGMLRVRVVNNGVIGSEVTVF